MGNKKVAIWGAGKMGIEYYPCISENYDVCFFVDSDSKKFGKTVTEDNIEILNDEKLADSDIDIVFIAIFDIAQRNSVIKLLNNKEITWKYIFDEFIDRRYEQEKDILDKKGYDASIHEINYMVFDEKIVKTMCFNLGSECCNFRCEYCYMFQHAGKEVFDNGYRRLYHHPRFMAYALRRDRVGGTCFVDICASGETLLIENITELIEAILLEGHIVCIVTNLTITPKVKEILQLPKALLNRVWFSPSFHFDELKKRGLIDTFFDNINRIKDSPCSLSVNIVGCDAYVPFIDDIYDMFEKKAGFLPQIDYSRDDTDNKNAEHLTKYSSDEYIEIWKKFDSAKFEHRIKYVGKKINGTCYAGRNYFYIDSYTGDILPCIQVPTKIANLYENMDDDFTEDIIRKCPVEWCINSIYVVPFGVAKDEADEMRHGDCYNRIDNKGNSMIKPRLLSLLNQKLVNPRAENQGGYRRRLTALTRYVIAA